jgi:hypothetical protein
MLMDEQTWRAAEDDHSESRFTGESRSQPSNSRSGWLDTPSDKAKEYILMLLGRIPASRDFIRGIKER